MAKQHKQTQESEQTEKGPQRVKIQAIEEMKDDQKQKLQRPYSIWVLMKQGKQMQQIKDSYENVLKHVATFDTVEDFWAIYQHLKRPTQMPFGTSLNIFSDGIKPLWEHEACKDGGRWILRVPKTHTNKYWEDLTLAMIGEQFQIENEVIGIALSLKPTQDVISVWNRSGKDQTKIAQIQAEIEQVLKIDDDTIKLEYENFAEVLSRPKQEKTYDKPQEEGTNTGFERGVGFSRGRGRGHRDGRGSEW